MRSLPGARRRCCPGIADRPETVRVFVGIVRKRRRWRIPNPGVRRNRPLPPRGTASLRRTSRLAGTPPRPRAHTTRIRHGCHPRPCVTPLVGKGKCAARFATPRWVTVPGLSAVAGDRAECPVNGVVRRVPR